MLKFEIGNSKTPRNIAFNKNVKPLKLPQNCKDEIMNEENSVEFIIETKR